MRVLSFSSTSMRKFKSFMTLFRDCQLDNYMVNIGKKVNSFSGFFDGIINSVFRGSQNIEGIDTTAATLNRKNTGINVGSFVKLFTNVNTPEAALTFT